MLKLLPLLLPVVNGKLLTTLILYALPVKRVEGRVAKIGLDVPAPIARGEEKLPFASDNCAVKKPGKIPVVEKFTTTAKEVFAQNGEPEILEVAIVLFTQLLTVTLLIEFGQGALLTV